jgi:hypothetical protein
MTIKIVTGIGAEKLNAAAPPVTITYPKRAQLFWDQALQVAGAAGWDHQHDATQDYAFYRGIAVPAVNDALTFSMLLRAGTYTLEVLGTTSTSRGTYKWQLNGVDIITGQDWYSASITKNVKKSTGGIVVATDGLQVLKFVCTGKNASASNYNHYNTYVAMLPGVD